MGEQKVRRLTPEEMAQLQEVERQWRLELMPPQQDLEGIDRQCVLCKRILNPLANRDYDATVGGYCNKLCRREHEKKLMMDGMTPEEASIEIDKLKKQKPVRHSPVLV